MKEKLYIINGGGLRWINQSTFVTNLKQFYNVIDIGDHDTGLDYAKFSEYFIDKIEPTTKNLNIILNTHGHVLNGKYMLGVSKLPVKNSPYASA